MVSQPHPLEPELHQRWSVTGFSSSGFLRKVVSDATFRDTPLQNGILAPTCVQVTNGSVCGISVPNGGIMGFFKMQLRVSVSVVPLKKRMH